VSSGRTRSDPASDLTNTIPPKRSGTVSQWVDPQRIVSLDPRDTLARGSLRNEIRDGIDVREYAHQRARIDLPELQAAIEAVGFKPRRPRSCTKTEAFPWSDRDRPVCICRGLADLPDHQRNNLADSCFRTDPACFRNW